MNRRPRLPLYGPVVTAIGVVLLHATLTAQNPTWRPVILGKKHMVAAGHYATARAGYRMLEQGGNALDAGVAPVVDVFDQARGAKDVLGHAFAPLAALLAGGQGLVEVLSDGGQVL